MMRFIVADGLFINLGVVVMIEDTSPDDAPGTKARLTPLVGDEIDIDDAAELFDRLAYLAQETSVATARLKEAEAILEQASNIAGRDQ